MCCSKDKMKFKCLNLSTTNKLRSLKFYIFNLNLIFASEITLDQMNFQSFWKLSKNNLFHHIEYSQ